MKKRPGKSIALAVIFLTVLTVLFILSSTDLVFKEKQNKIYHISVIVPNSNAQLWENYRQGLNEAAAYYNADISFVTMYDNGGAKEQCEAVEREIQNGAQAVIICAADSEYTAKHIDEVRHGVPVVALCVDIDSGDVRARVLYDHAETGRQLAAAVVKDVPDINDGNIKVIQICGSESWQSSEIIAREFSAAAGCDIYENQTVYNSAQAQRLVAGLCEDGGEYVLLAMDTEETDIMAQSIEELKCSDRIRLYSVGISNEVKAYLEKGVVKAAVCSREYPAGYKSIEFAVNLIDGTMKKQLYSPEVFTVTGENMFDEETEKKCF